jgi:hypothetical protein
MIARMPKTKHLQATAAVLAVMLFSVAIWIWESSSDAPPPSPDPQRVRDPSESVPTAAAVKYEVVKSNNTSFAGRTRLRAFIVAPEAKTPEQRAQTALKAAVDAQKETGFDYIFVQLMYDRNAWTAGWAAEGEYARDGKDQGGETPLAHGVWSARACDFTPTDDDLKIVIAWDQKKEDFRKDDGTLNERALRSAVAKELDTQVDAVEEAILRLVMRPRKLEPYNGP